MSEKRRLDILMVERGLAESRNRAKLMIERGLVSCKNGAKLMKPGQEVAIDIELEIAEAEQWVSRAALKLDFALQHWGVKLGGKICLDVGVSTGGFTEVLIKNSAAKIYAVDVGHGQLHMRLWGHEKIVLLEKTNARDLDERLIPEAIDLIVCDVSFISLEKALPPALALGKELIALIKPQYEVGRENIGNGIVRDAGLHALVCDNIKAWLQGQNWTVSGLADSPITGGDGNKEFLIYAQKK